MKVREIKLGSFSEKLAQDKPITRRLERLSPCVIHKLCDRFAGLVTAPPGLLVV